MTFRDRKIWRKLLKIKDSRSGGVLVFTAIATPVLLGFAGLAIDVTLWHTQQQVIQTAADIGAVAGAAEIVGDGDGGSVSINDAAGFAIVANLGAAQPGDVVTINNPPLSGAFAGDDEAVEVILARPATMFLTAMFMTETPTIDVRAVARVELKDSCIWTLDPSSMAAVKVTGTAEVNLDCTVRINSNNSNALKQNGSGCLTAKGFEVAGGFSASCIGPTPSTDAGSFDDPLAPLPSPDFSGCDYPTPTNISTGTATLSPGVYCESISISSDELVTFEPGIYIIDGAGISITGQANIIGDGVTFFFTGSTEASDVMKIAGGADVAFTAPDSGIYAGILLHNDPDCGTCVVESGPGSGDPFAHSFTGGTNMQLDGIIYAPNQHIKFAGGTAATASKALIVSATVTFTGNSTFGGMQSTTIAKSPFFTFARLVE